MFKTFVSLLSGHAWYIVLLASNSCCLAAAATGIRQSTVSHIPRNGAFADVFQSTKQV